MKKVLTGLEEAVDLVKYGDLMTTGGRYPGKDVCVYSKIENLVLWARSELDGSALGFCVSEYWSNGEL